MPLFLKTYLTSLLLFLAIDAVWLGVIAKNMYKKYLGHLLADNVNFVAAVIFYLLYLAGLTYFITYPHLQSPTSHLKLVTIQGGLLSALCYATYDLTNQATLPNWPTFITVVDIVWGFALGAFVCGMTFVILYKS